MSSSHSQPGRPAGLIAALVLSLLAVLAGWSLANRPVSVPENWDGPVASVSFAPFRWGQSPLTRTYPSLQQVEEDMVALKGLTTGLRTYTSQEGMEVVPDLARKHGFTVTHSAWLGVTPTTNEKEVAALIQAANQHPDVIKRVIVGNEVLLRRDLKPAKLVEYIERVKAKVDQPVSYADVWAFYLKHPQVGHAVDYLTIHILPYWEDEPQHIDDVETHILKIVKRMREAFPGKPILIGEAGWPTAGRSRGPAVPSVENAARFNRILAKVAAENGLDYNVVEAFDQPWKAALEGTVGARWGLVDADRNWRYTLTGPVMENPRWTLEAAASAVLVLLAVAGFWHRLVQLPLREQAAFCLFAGVLAALLTHAATTAYGLSYSSAAEAWAGVRVLALALMSVACLEAASRLLGRRTAPLSPRSGWQSLCAGWGAAPVSPGVVAEGLYLLMTATALGAAAWLAIDGRYRDIPVADIAPVVAGMLGLGLLRRAQGLGWAEAFALGRLFSHAKGAGRASLLDRLAVWLLVLAALATVAAEGRALIGEDFTKDHPTLADQAPLILIGMWRNLENLAWAGLLLVLALPFLATLRQARK